jgi:hypothetical protein
MTRVITGLEKQIALRIARRDRSKAIWTCDISNKAKFVLKIIYFDRADHTWKIGHSLKRPLPYAFPENWRVDGALTEITYPYVDHFDGCNHCLYW